MKDLAQGAHHIPIVFTHNPASKTKTHQPTQANGERVQQVIQKLLVQGVFADWFLNCDTALRLAPALTINDEDIDWACEQIREAAGCG
jgi:4-aminobutyrate aminotransferase-like enzyme